MLLARSGRYERRQRPVRLVRPVRIERLLARTVTTSLHGDSGAPAGDLPLLCTYISSPVSAATRRVSSSFELRASPASNGSLHERRRGFLAE